MSVNGRQFMGGPMQEGVEKVGAPRKTGRGDAAETPGITYVATVQLEIRGARGLNDAAVKARELLKRHRLQGRVLRVD